MSLGKEEKNFEVWTMEYSTLGSWGDEREQVKETEEENQWGRRDPGQCEAEGRGVFRRQKWPTLATAAGMLSIMRMKNSSMLE